MARLPDRRLRLLEISQHRAREPEHEFIKPVPTEARIVWKEDGFTGLYLPFWELAGGLEPPTCCLQDSSESSTACWRVFSLQLRSDGLSSQCAPVGPSSAWWNDIENDMPSRISRLPTPSAVLSQPQPRTSPFDIAGDREPSG